MRGKKYYYYANERGCLRHHDSLDELGIGIDQEGKSAGLVISLIRFKGFGEPVYSMKLLAHNDMWKAFTECRDVLELLSGRVIPSGEMRSEEPFYDLRRPLERLGYRDLGVLQD